MQCERGSSANLRSSAFISGPLNRPPLPQRRVNLLHRHLHLGAHDAGEHLAEEPAMLEAFSFELSSRTAGFQIDNAVFNHVHELMAMPTDHVAHAVFPRELMEWELAALKLYRD